MQGIERVFFYSGFSRDEVAEGSNFIAAAKASGIKHLIYSSGAAAAPENGLAGAAKMLVELEILDSGVPYTILRPVAFMENFDRQQARTLQNGIRDSRDPERMLHFIAIQDIGLLVAEAFENPGQWLLPLDEYLEMFPQPLRPLFRWYDEVGYTADVKGLREQYPQLMTLEQYLRATGWENWKP
jgi:uncharacterized protein YbjT (DUF2867 family)